MATKLKGQGTAAGDVASAVVVFGALIAVAILVLVSVIDAIPQDEIYNNETLSPAVISGDKASAGQSDYQRMEVDNAPMYTGSTDVTVFNGTGGQVLTEGAEYVLNDSTGIYAHSNATGFVNQSLRITYTHNRWDQDADKDAQTTIDQANTNWNNSIQLIAVALIVLAAGAIILYLRGFGGAAT